MGVITPFITGFWAHLVQVPKVDLSFFGCGGTCFLTPGVAVGIQSQWLVHLRFSTIFHRVILRRLTSIQSSKLLGFNMGSDGIGWDLGGRFHWRIIVWWVILIEMNSAIWDPPSWFSLRMKIEGGQINNWCVIPGSSRYVKNSAQIGRFLGWIKRHKF